MRKFFLIFSLLYCHTGIAKSALTHYGDGMRYLLPAVAIGTSIWQTDWQGARQFGYSYISAMSLVRLLKTQVKEQRPRGHSHHSFPSGHTTSAYVGAAFLQRRYGLKLGAPAYLAATLVGVARVHAKAHYWHDVFAGAVIGVGSSLFFTQPFKHLELTPIIGEQPGIRLVLHR